MGKRHEQQEDSIGLVRSLTYRRMLARRWAGPHSDVRGAFGPSTLNQIVNFLNPHLLDTNLKALLCIVSMDVDGAWKFEDYLTLLLHPIMHWIGSTSIINESRLPWPQDFVSAYLSSNLARLRFAREHIRVTSKYLVAPATIVG